MINIFVSFIFGIIFISLLIYGIKKITGKKIKYVKALGVEGEKDIKKLTELDLDKDGSILKDSVAGKQFSIVTSPIQIDMGNKKKKKGFLGLGVKEKKLIKLNIETDESGNVFFEETKGKTVPCYLVDLDKGCTIDMEKDETLIKLKTTPELINNVLDSNLLKDAFGLRPSRGVIMIVFLVATGIGYFLGKIF